MDQGIATIILAVATLLAAFLAHRNLEIFLRRKPLEDLIIVINGASGVGKSSVALGLSRRYDIPSVT